MILDADRGMIYAITWPRGYFISYNLATGQLRDHGLVSANGEAGIPGDDYRVLCRSMFVDPKDGIVYLSTSEGDILYFRPGASGLEKLEEINLKLDYFEIGRASCRERVCQYV